MRVAPGRANLGSNNLFAQRRRHTHVTTLPHVNVLRESWHHPSSCTTESRTTLDDRCCTNLHPLFVRQPDRRSNCSPTIALLLPPRRYRFLATGERWRKNGTFHTHFLDIHHSFRLTAPPTLSVAACGDGPPFIFDDPGTTGGT